jgi:hypothetical protein
VLYADFAELHLVIRPMHQPNRFGRPMSIKLSRARARNGPALVPFSWPPRSATARAARGGPRPNEGGRGAGGGRKSDLLLGSQGTDARASRPQNFETVVVEIFRRSISVAALSMSGRALALGGRRHPRMTINEMLAEQGYRLHRSALWLMPAIPLLPSIDRSKG